jgi:hypothetical protein
MIPLVHGQWTEVRTLAVGAVQPAKQTADGSVVRTTNLSYFSRRTDSTSFRELATLELHRRGIEAARRVGAVVDGADWCRTFVDYQYAEAVRILDVAHAAEHVTPIAATAAAVGVQAPAATRASAGVTATKGDRKGDGVHFRFRASQCRDCPLWSQCRDPEASPKGHRAVFISDYHVVQREADAFNHTPEGRALLGGRWQVEPVLAWLVRYQGCRQTRRVGQAAAQCQLDQAAAVRNLLCGLSRVRRGGAPEPPYSGEQNA